MGDNRNRTEIEARLDRDLVATCLRDPQSADAGRAFATLMARHQPGSIRVALRYLRNVEDAREVAQDAFLAVWRHLADYDPSCAFTTWLYRIVVNRSIDYLRRPHAKRKLAEAHGPDGETLGIEETLARFGVEGDPSPEAVAIHRERYAAEREAIESLSKAQREAINDRIEGLSYQEIAERRGIALGTALSRVFYGRRSLEIALEGD